jgi:16S rRNA G966 N2-methylase RsmD
MQRASAGAFELVLLDPPFDANLDAPALAAATRLVAPGGFIYLESARPLADVPAGWLLHRQARAGAVHFQLLRRSD